MVPQGWKGEFDGWRAADAWSNAIARARQAEALGFESLWVFDHFTTVPQPTDEITFESFTMLGRDRRRRRSGSGSGTWWSAPGFRNPALTAKMSSTLDVISGGRFELGIGAGWKEDEWIAYGYGFPPLRERLAVLADHLEIIRRMLEPGRASYEGRYARVDGAINVPKGIQQPRIPIIVGGNGQNVTFRLRRPLRRRAQPRLPGSRRRSGSAWPWSASAARRRAATRPRCGSRSTAATATSARWARSASTGWAPSRRWGWTGSSRSRRAGTRPTTGSPRFAEDVRAAGLPLAGERAGRTQGRRGRAGGRAARQREPADPPRRPVAEPRPGHERVRVERAVAARVDRAGRRVAEQPGLAGRRPRPERVRARRRRRGREPAPPRAARPRPPRA